MYDHIDDSAAFKFDLLIIPNALIIQNFWNKC